MRILSLVLVALFGYCLSASAQVDVNSVVADPMTFTFNDGKHTVHGYVYSMLEKATSCCGNDAIYLEVVFDNTGRVTSTKTLTGKNDCYKQSVKDIIRNVRWDASGVKSSKTIYFEVKPIIPCSGSGNENVYKEVPLQVTSNPVATNNNNSNNAGNDDNGDDDMGDDDMGDNSGDDDVAMGDDDMGDDSGNDDMGDDSGDDDVAVGDDDMGDDSGDDDMGDNSGDDDVVADAGDDSGDDGFLSDDSNVSNTNTNNNNAGHDDGWANMYDSGDDGDDNDNSGDNANFTSHDDAGDSHNATASNNRTTSNNGKIPGQADYEYSSSGDHDPNEGHKGSFKNVPGPTLVTPAWANDESRVAVLIKQSLRKNGVCGLAQALIELTLDPQGNVINHNVLKTNSDQVTKLLPEVLKEVKFKPQPEARFNYVTYIQFKTDIICQAESRKPVDLDTVQDYIIIDK